MRATQRFGRWLLAVALIVAQHGVHAHALSHLEEAPYGDVRPDHGAEVCVAFAAASGGAVAASDLKLPTGPGPDGLVAPAPTDPFLAPLALTRFASRAPPFAS